MVEETQSAEQTGPVEEEQEEIVDDQQPESPSAEELKALKQEAEAHIDAFMKQVGYNPPDRTDEAGWRYFTLGTAEGRAGIVQIDAGLFLRVEALVMTMPSDKELILPLMRELLNINIELTGPVRLGIEGDNIYTALLYPVKALKDEQYPDMIHWTMALADQIDDGLLKKYGGTVKIRGDQPPTETAAPVAEAVAQPPYRRRVTMLDVHPYARELAQKVGANTRRQVSIKARTLLKGFGYFRRTPAIIQEINRHLENLNLASDFNMVYPHNLDDRVGIRLAGPGLAPVGLNRVGVQNNLDPISAAVAATVEIFTDTGTGSGFIVHPDGLVITGRHVINNEDGTSLRKVKVCLYSQQKNELTLEGTVFRSHKRLDFALLWLDGPRPYPVLPLGDPQQARHTQTVYAIGAPAGLPNTVSRGIISNPVAHFNMLECLQSDAAIDRGNSGGPLVTRAGHAIGINLWGLGDFDAAKFSVPVDYLNVTYSDGVFTNLTDFSTINPQLNPPLTQDDVVKLYAAKHNPFVYFQNVQEGTNPLNSYANVVDFDGPTGLYADLRAGQVPNFLFIVPNQCNDQHGRSNAGAFCNFDPASDGTQASLNPALILMGDQTVQRVVTAIQASPIWAKGHNAIVVMWDENDYSIAPNVNQVMFIVDTNYGSHGVSSNVYYNHYSLLKTLDQGFRLPCLNHACDADVSAMSDLFAQ